MKELNRCHWLVGAVFAGLMLALVTQASAEWSAGMAAYKKKDYATAIREFEQVTQTNPDYAGAYYMLGVVQSSSGKVSAALANLRKAVELDGKNVSYKVFLGQVLIQAKQYQDAYSTLKQVNPSAVDSAHRSRFVLFFAKAATEANQPNDAIKALNAQIKADAKNAGLYQALGEAYGSLDNDKQRFAAFQKAFELNPKDEDSAVRAAHAAIAVARRAAADSEKVRYYTSAGKIADQLATLDGSFDHLLLAGEAWLGAKQFDKALVWFGKAKQKRSRTALVSFYRGQCYSSLNKFNNALTELQESLALGPTGKLRTQIYNQLGYVHAKMKNYEQAKKDYGEAGNTAKVAEMQDSIEKAEQNAKADEERQVYEQKLAALRLQIQELRKIGEDAEADQLQKQLDDLVKPSNK